WQTSPWFHGTFIMSMALWGTVIGAIFGGFPTNKYGRQTTLFWIGVLYFISAVGSALATDPYISSVFRFIGGLGVGVSSIAAPTYTSEIATPANRGKLVALFQFNIVFGILIAYISNYLLDGVGGANDWRLMLGVEAVPALAYTIMVLGVPKSPRWLALHQHNHQAAMKVLRLTSTDEEAEKILTDIKRDQGNQQVQEASVFSRQHKTPLVLAFLIALFNQLSGINFILYYAPEILEKAGFGGSDSLFNAISIGVINLVFTMLGLVLIDRAGRKQLMYIGSIGYIVSLSLLSYGFYSEAGAYYKLTFILSFIASHAIGQGAVIWVFIAEIFPNRVRAYGQSWGAATHWVFAALITLFGAVMIRLMAPHYIFTVFAILMICQLLFVWLLMPETKGKSLEDIEEIESSSTILSREQTNV
ncbi:MAG: sugar porter family MFS transporter, partial [Cyclobacteriaceae bacterium]|nr:sugar porter family MFS transporter [Cyclobacteriaceae bacterium HetDA_MAG_MS6]